VSPTVLCLLIVAAFSVQADTIYTNFGTGDTYSAGAGVIVTSDGSAWSSVAIAFTPSENYNLTSIEFVATDLFQGDPSGVTLGIFADSNGQPGGAPLESFTAGPLDAFGETVPVITVTSLLQPLLLANTQYWVGMNAAPGDMIVWNQNLTSADGFSETDGSGNWSVSDPLQDQGVVEIDGTLAGMIQQPQPTQSSDSGSSTPEPATWWLVASALSALAIFTHPTAPAPPQPKTTTR
jgi:hypothetical protein